MVVRLVLVAKGKWRWKPVESKEIIDESSARIFDKARELNTQVVPRLTGRLQESFETERDENTLRFKWNAPHAQYVDEGFPKSEGRYVPVIDKRLVNRQLSPRTQVYREAIKSGYDRRAARIAKTIKITESVVPGGRRGMYIERPGKKPEIVIMRGLPRKEKNEAIRHELWHAVEGAAQKRRMPIVWSKQEEEFRAGYGALVSGLQERNIGMHPGFKGHHFAVEFLDQLKAATIEIVKDVINERVKI